ncbi:MAG: tripartite tricarboxylate transporter permease [Microvirga sp.]|nr:tripartite tricarboxylate transporter permease [Microvirga sp.]
MSSLADLSSNLMIGLATATTPSNLFYCFVGVFLGTLLGVIPGIGVLVSISLLFPLTFHLDPTAGIIMLAGIYYGTTYGGSTASILLNLPGTPANAVTCLDGHPMSKQGRAGVALLMTTVASFVGGTVGIVVMTLFSPVIANNALLFGAREYFALMLLGLVAASTISVGSPIKALAMVTLGIVFGIVGADVNTGISRFTFQIIGLIDGISIVAIAMGIFGIAEVIESIRKLHGQQLRREDITLRSMMPTRDDVRRSIMPMARGSVIGSFFGALPGTGGLIASFMAYATEKRVARDPSRFGNGAIEGIMAPETANNAADQTAFIPTLTLGIPGSATMAIILGVLIIHGITPGPLLVTQQPELFWGLVMSFWIGNLLLLIINIPMIGLWVKLLSIPYRLLYPAILMFVCLGVYSLNQNSFDVWIVLFFGVVGYMMRVFELPAAPMILGFVLGPLMETQFRRSLLISDGDLLTFFSRPISATILTIALLMLAWAIVSPLLKLRRRIR